MTFGEMLKKLRLQYKLKQDDVAKKLGVSQQIISSYETNSNSPSIEVLLSLAKTFDVSIDYLVGYSKIPKNDTRFTPDEIELFELYDGLTEEKKVLSKEFIKLINKCLT